jgi:hypothetical protein
LTGATFCHVPTDKPLADMWATRDFPVLVEATRRIDAGESTVSPTEVAGTLGMEAMDVQRAGAALARRGLVQITDTDQDLVAFFFGVSGQAYLLTGLHPDGDDALDRLVSIVNQSADRAADPVERTRLQRAASAVGELAGTVGAGVMTAYLTSLLPH